jgi:hypothetical protein
VSLSADGRIQNPAILIVDPGWCVVGVVGHTIEK